MPLLPLIHDHVARRTRSADLLQQIQRQVRRHTHKLPGVWFELGERSEESLESLGNRVFTRCDRARLGRHPFKGRTPFVSFHEDEPSERDIFGHTFRYRPSVLWDEVRADYAANMCRDPWHKREAELYKALGRVLPDIATRSGNGRGALWRSRSTGPRRVRTPDAVKQVIAERWSAHLWPPEAKECRPVKAIDLADIAEEALGLLGRAATHSELAALLHHALPKPARYRPGEPSSPARAMDRAALAETLRRLLADLTPHERRLLRDLARGLSAEEIMRRQPDMRSRSTLSKRLKKLSALCTQVLSEAADLTPPGSPPPRPQDFMLEVSLTLQSLLPEWQEGDVA